MSMDPEAPTQAAPDTPDPAATQAEIDWQKRYEDLRPEFDRKSQAAAEYERLVSGDDPDRLKEILDKYGYALDEDDPDPDPDPADTADPVKDPRVDELAKKQQAFEEWQQQQVEAQAKQQFAEDLQAEAGDREVTDKARDWIELRTLTTGNNREALAKATKEWFEFEDSLRGPSRRPRAPHVPAGGQPATSSGKAPEDMTRRELDEFMLERLRAGQA